MFDRAVVIGCGIAGVAAAAALRPYCEQVVMLEKDRLPTEPTSRRGVPQGKQLHQLLTRAQVHLEQLLPGFRAAMLEAGAGEARVANETHVFELGIQWPERDVGLRLMAAPRPIIEHVARQLLFSSNVEVREGVSVSGVHVASSGEVTGVEVGSDLITAQLVVDASGSGSKAPKWLSKLGCENAPVDQIQVSQWYVSTVVQRPKQWADANDFWMVFPSWPNTRGALVSPIGANHWYVSVSGRAGDESPSTFEEVKSYAATLESPSIAELLSQARPTGPPNRFTKPTASWRRYDQIRQPLLGFLPMGDAMASLNPLFGQGMSVAAWEASELRGVLAEGWGDVQDLTHRYLSRASAACQAAWNLGELVDQQAGRIENLAELVREDPKLHRRYVGVWHLVEPVSSLST